jgi:hypothetical protein
MLKKSIADNGFAGVERGVGDVVVCRRNEGSRMRVLAASRSYLARAASCAILAARLRSLAM